MTEVNHVDVYRVLVEGMAENIFILAHSDSSIAAMIHRPGLRVVEKGDVFIFSLELAGGGGFPAAFRDLATEIGMSKIKKAEASGAEILSSACPFCHSKFNSGIRHCEK